MSDRTDANALLAAAYVIARRSDEQRRKRTLVTMVLIKVLTDIAQRISREAS